MKWYFFISILIFFYSLKESTTKSTGNASLKYKTYPTNLIAKMFVTFSVHLLRNQNCNFKSILNQNEGRNCIQSLPELLQTAIHSTNREISQNILVNLYHRCGKASPFFFDLVGIKTRSVPFFAYLYRLEKGWLFSHF